MVCRREGRSRSISRFSTDTGCVVERPGRCWNTAGPRRNTYETGVHPMPKLVLARGDISPTDELVIVLSEPDNEPAAVLIHWPPASSVASPMAFPTRPARSPRSSPGPPYGSHNTKHGGCRHWKIRTPGALNPHGVAATRGYCSPILGRAVAWPAPARLRPWPSTAGRPRAVDRLGLAGELAAFWIPGRPGCRA